MDKTFRIPYLPFLIMIIGFLFFLIKNYLLLNIIYNMDYYKLDSLIGQMKNYMLKEDGLFHVKEGI